MLELRHSNYVALYRPPWYRIVAVPSKFLVNSAPVVVAKCYPRDIHDKLIDCLQIKTTVELVAIMQLPFGVNQFSYCTHTLYCTS